MARAERAEEKALLDRLELEAEADAMNELPETCKKHGTLKVISPDGAWHCVVCSPEIADRNWPDNAFLLETEAGAR